jgi:hypothetical protein
MESKASLSAMQFPNVQSSMAPLLSGAVPISSSETGLETSVVEGVDKVNGCVDSEFAVPVTLSNHTRDNENREDVDEGISATVAWL